MSTEPLGLPRGSIRAILTLMLSVAWAGTEILANYNISNEFRAVALGAIMSYFGSRPVGPEPGGPTPPTEEPT